MLEMRPGCERCDKDLAPQEHGARICSFECTFCTNCADTVFQGICPNCGGELVARPTRRQELLTRFPASTKRIYKPE